MKVKLWSYLGCMAMVGMASSAYANGGDTLSVSGSCDDNCMIYVSTDNSVIGTLVGSLSGSGSLQYLLNSSLDYYIHVVAQNNGGAGGAILSWTLSNSTMSFANGTQAIDGTSANASYWQSIAGGALNSAWLTPNETAVSETGTPGIYNNNVLWDPNAGPNASAWNGQCFNCQVDLSTTVGGAAPSPVPEPISAGLLVTGVIAVGAARRRKAAQPA